MCANISSVSEFSTSTLFNAVVTICVFEDLMARPITSFDGNLPVPKKSLELNSFPAIINFSIFMFVFVSSFIRFPKRRFVLLKRRFILLKRRFVFVKRRFVFEVMRIAKSERRLQFHIPLFQSIQLRLRFLFRLWHISEC